MALLQYPEYQCHKKVRALKISVVEYLPGERVCLQFHDSRYSPIIVSTMNRPKPNNDFYYVEYERGYFSFSPPEEFEDGYTLIKPPTMDKTRMLEENTEIATVSEAEFDEFFIFALKGFDAVEVQPHELEAL